MKKKMVTVLLTMAMTAALLAGCGSSAEDTAAETTPSAETETTEAGDGDGAEEAAEE